MNTITSEAAETVKIENALDALLAAAIRADRDPALVAERGLTSAGTMIGELLDRMENWTRAQQAAHDLFTRPVAEVCRQAVSTLGMRLHEIGGIPLMIDVAYRVADRDERTRDRRMGIMNHRWDGIGDWAA
ncbi:MAG: hypothetical protein JNK30_21135 [Phenylobacterium sp.]|uniref:hypothetical protein n=1 Tax=Phenylobacterium sp. TaxID=1871053 RepID=UPI001A56EAF4|nr:hypothetical protein [Phenylobacterium sp.]MBL8773905.1 hypothetical protein [Phenylobacterium sp.]